MAAFSDRQLRKSASGGDDRHMKLYVAALALVGCTQGSSPVKGHLEYRYPGGTTVPIDLSQVQYQVLVPSGDGYDRYPEQPVLGTAEGTFEIPDVPDGPYWLQSNVVGGAPSIAFHNQRELESTEDVLGRPDDVQVAAPTPLMIDATNLAAWGPMDQLYIDCWENATEASTPTFMPALGAGAEAIHGSFDWSNQQDVYSFGPTRPPRLMRAGDHVVISHEADQQTTPVATLVLAQYLMAEAPAQVSGQSATISGGFQDVPPYLQMTITVDPARFEPSPGVTTNWNVSAAVGLGTAQGFSIGPELFAAGQNMPTTATTTTVTYGNPFEVSWTPLLIARFEEEWSVEGFELPVTLAYEDRPLGASDFTFEPLPPTRNVTIDGHAITGTLQATAGVALPLEGTLPDGASYVEVAVWHSKDGLPSVAGNVYSDHLPIDLPAELFQSGERYAFQILAYSTDGDRHLYSSATTDAFIYTAQ